jgi:hypothetical protein
MYSRAISLFTPFFGAANLRSFYSLTNIAFTIVSNAFYLDKNHRTFVLVLLLLQDTLKHTYEND